MHVKGAWQLDRACRGLTATSGLVHTRQALLQAPRASASSTRDAIQQDSTGLRHAQQARSQTLQRIPQEVQHASGRPKTQKGPDMAEALFPTSHTPQLTPLLIIYFPFGCAIAAARMVLWLTLLLADQAWLTDSDLSIAVLQALLGIHVEWEGVDNIPSSRHVLVSNHVSTGDLMVLYRRPIRYVHLVSTALPIRVAQAQHHRVDLRHASPQMYDSLAAPGQAASVHLFPEGGMTNGAGMMKFSRGFMRFADGLPVVPTALRAELPWGIQTHTLTSSFLANLFWFCFPPFVRLHVTVLPPLMRREGQLKAKFVEEVQQCIARELKSPIHDMTFQAKRSLVQSMSKK